MDSRQVTVLIAGGASGLGAGCTRHLAARGANVVILDQDLRKAEFLADQIGKNALAVEADVTSEEDILEALAEAKAVFGAVHVLINTAGIEMALRTISKNGPHPLDVFETVLNVNLVGTFNVLRLTAMEMAKNDPDANGERGVIINTASIAATDGQVGQAAYAASKGGLMAMTLPISRDLARDGIRLVSLIPDATGSTHEAQSEELLEPPRLVKAEDFAQAVQTIIENETLNGVNLRLDEVAAYKR